MLKVQRLKEKLYLMEEAKKYLYSSIKLKRIATKSEDALWEVKSCLQPLIQRGESYKYLNRFLISFENKYYEKNNSIINIKEAMSIVDYNKDNEEKHEGVVGKKIAEDDYVYISYNWEEKSSYAVDHLCLALETQGVPYRRDRNDCNYLDNIKAFMDAIRAGKTVIVVFSRPYLKSLNCMYELSGIMEDPSYRGRLLPIVVDDTIRADLFYLELVKYWKVEMDQMEKTVNNLNAIDPQMAKPKEIKLGEIKKVYSLLAEINDYLEWTNAFSLDRLSPTHFKPVIDKIYSRM